MSVELVGDIRDVELIARGPGIRVLRQLREMYGSGSWRKLKGIARVRLPDGATRLAEVHFYESHGIGRRGIKVKRYLD
jgi:hypothetical protein